MSDDARSQFVDGLRVTADHLQHLQDRLRESVLDLRRSIGLGKVAWGLRVTLDGGAVRLDPGLAFAPSGVRLAVDAPLNLGPPAGAARVVARASNSDVQALRVGATPTLIQLLTQVTLEPDDGTALDADALLLARILPGEGGATVDQPGELFAAGGRHAHTGTQVQDAQGRWHYDGLPLAGLKGDQGEPGEAGPVGPVGPIGPFGPIGPVGPVGPIGPTGPAGADGSAGAGGPVGEVGPAGADGATGPAGAAGPAGPAGEAGPAGTVGDPGPAGPLGEPGPAGSPGPAGEAGPVGSPGPAGPAGADGPAGQNGEPGAQGEAGPAGPRGEAGPPGSTGPSGATGTTGTTGPAGPAGPPAALDWPFVSRVNWPHGQQVPLPQALDMLGKLEFELSVELAGQTIERQPAVVQVWFEPNASATAASSPLPMLTLHGTARLSARTVLWRLTDAAAAATRALGPGGRLLIRLHTGLLQDKDGRAFSAALDALLGTPQPHVPGGTFEGWLFVRAG